MIDINLLIRPPKPLHWKRVLALAGTLGVLAVAGLYGAGWLQDYRSVQQERRALASLTTEYRGVLARADSIKKAEEGAQRQTAALDRIARNQRPGGQSPVLGAVLAAADGRVSVLEVEFSKNGEVLISGEASSFAEALAYLRALRAMEPVGLAEERRLEAGDPDGRVAFLYAARAVKGGAAP